MAIDLTSHYVYLDAAGAAATVTGGDAERLYLRSGWQRAGDVPKFALMPDGAFCATTFYYKHL